jgi:hypothetical protein
MGPSASQPHAAAAADRQSDVLDLSVVIVNYNVREFLEQALRSVFRAGADLEMEVFVVDNSSVDGSPGMVRTHFPEVRLIANATNRGFGAANNQAIRTARGRYLLILNPDTIVQEDTFSTMVRFMDSHPKAGAVGCKILHPDGSFARESRRAFPTPRVAFYRLVGLATLFPHSALFGRYNMTHLPEDQVAEVDALSGSCMLVRRSAILGSGDAPDGVEGAGLFDENFFMYGEDLDWCYRIQQAGWKIFYTPDTQIIHYKGESTKKGELRYVRLFYGAMLRFTEKHFENRYSRLFAFLLRCGIVVRAVLSLAGKAVRTFAWPLLDFAAVYAAASAAAGLHAASLQTYISPLYFAAVAPAYALGSVAGIAAAGGYGRRPRIRSVWIGVFIGLLIVASASFFVKNIAFSRLVVLLTYPLAALTATVARLIWSRRDRDATSVRRAVLVGRHGEAVRLQNMLARHPSPPFALEGHLSSRHDASAPNGRNGTAAPAWLGRADQLRDVVRLRGIQEVVFASATLSNQAIFRHIQQVRDLSVHVRILAEGRDHVIGKASVDDLSMVSLVEADEALVHTRPPAARRLFEVAVALLGFLVHPFVAAAARLSGPVSRAACLAERTRVLPDVLRGSRSLVGYADDRAYRPPPEWNLQPGVFTVADAVDFCDDDTDAIATAYWFYVRNQSASLDWDIMIRSLRRPSSSRAAP